MSGANLTGQCNWHQISTTGENYTDRTDYVSKGSMIANHSTKQQNLHPGPTLRPALLTIIVYVTIMSVTPVRCIGSGVWTYLFFCSPSVPPSSWGGQVAKGCKSGVASRSAQTTTTTLVHPSLKFPWNSSWFLRLVDEVSTKQNLILLSAVQQLVSSPHPTKFVSKLGTSTQKKQFNPFPLTVLKKTQKPLITIIEII